MIVWAPDSEGYSAKGLEQCLEQCLEHRLKQCPIRLTGCSAPVLYKTGSGTIPMGIKNRKKPKNGFSGSVFLDF